MVCAGNLCNDPSNQQNHAFSFLAGTCRPGQGLDPDTDFCVDCPSGKFSPANEATPCTICPAGYHASTSASEACAGCATGWYSGPQASVCYQCAAGSVTDKLNETGGTICEPCAPGHFSPDPAARCDPISYLVVLSA